jgi:DNA-binding transcriptional ArsR family regulator
VSDSAVSLAGLARLVADPSRAEMLASLLDGRAWTGRELARAANVTPSTASVHLARLVRSALVSVIAQGRHRYYRIGSPEVAHALESLMVLAPAPVPRHPSARALDAALRRARTCYDHLAGVLGVSLADALRNRGAIAFDEAGVRLTSEGLALFRQLGVAYDVAGRRPPCRACLDWSERRWHVAGVAGAALCRHALANEWVRRRASTRALDVTARGIAALYNSFGIVWTQELDRDFRGQNGEASDDAVYPLHA